MIRYFVSFSVTTSTGFGFGNTEVTTERPITTHEGIMAVEREMDRKFGDGERKILYFRALAEEPT